MKLLLVEDDRRTVEHLTKGLREEGYIVDSSNDGESALQLVLDATYDLIILDVMLPILDGWSVLREARKQQCRTPIIMLTARDAVEYRVRGLSLGADDYIVKPFAFAELLARIRSVLRRSAMVEAEQLEFADLKLDLRRHKVARAGIAIDLSAKEILLLELLLRHQDEVLSRTFIAELVWDMNFDSDSNVVDVNIRRLRAKIDDPYPTKIIHTVRGRGYVIR